MSRSEFDIIRRFFTDSGPCFPREGIVTGSGDDAAVLRIPPGRSLALSTDVLTAGSHFPAEADPAAIAYRALAVNLSDLAAMAAEPFCFTLGLTLADADDNWFAAFSGGLKELAERYNCPLVGGDLSEGPLNIAVQVQGLISGEPLLRSGAAVGDTVYVSGCIGDGAVALLSLGIPPHLGKDFQLSVSSIAAEGIAYLEAAFYRPQPRIDLALKLRPCLSACIDVSDGLAGDLGHILTASGVGARINVDKIPVSATARGCVDGRSLLRAALFGGDDYELCFTAAPRYDAVIQRLARESGTPVSAIGVITAGDELVLLDETGRAVEFDDRAFVHFR